MVLQNPQGSSLELQVASPQDSDGSVSLKLVEKGLHVDLIARNGAQGAARSGTIVLPLEFSPGGQFPRALSILCRITSAGLESAFPEPRTGSSFYIEHLKTSGGERRQGIWFASCAAALNVQSQTPILEYRIRDDVRKLVMTNTIPDGFIKLLYGVETVEVPAWVTLKHLTEKRYKSEGSDVEELTELLDDEAQIRKQTK